MRRAWGGAVIVAAAAAAVVGRGPEPPTWRTATPPGGALVGFAVAGREVVTVDPARPGGPVPLLRRYDARGTPLGATPLAVPPGRDRLAVVAAADGERAVIGAGRTAQVYDVHAGRPLGWPVRPHPAGPVALSADGRLLAFGDGDPAVVGPTSVTVIDLTLDRAPFTVPLPPGAMAADVRLDHRLTVLVTPADGGPRWMEHIPLSDGGDRPAVVRLPADRDWVRLGPPDDWWPVLVAAEGADRHAYALIDGQAERFPDGDPSARDVTVRCCRDQTAGLVRLRSWRGRGATAQRFDDGGLRLTGERTGLPADSLPHPDARSVVSLAADGALTLHTIVPPPRSWWPPAVAGAVPLGLVAVVAAWRAARRVRTARRWATAALIAAAGAALAASRPRWAVPVASAGGLDDEAGASVAARAVGFTPDGREVLAVERSHTFGDRDAVSLTRFDAATGDLRGRVRLTDRPGGDAATLSADGTRVLLGDPGSAGGPYDQTLFALHDTATGRRVRQAPVGVHAATLSPCGRWVLAFPPAGDRPLLAAVVVATADGTAVATIAELDGVAGVCFAPDGTAVAVPRLDGLATAVELIELPSGRPVRRVARPDIAVLTDWQGGRLFAFTRTAGQGGQGGRPNADQVSFDPWDDPATPPRGEPQRPGISDCGDDSGPSRGPGWFTRIAPVHRRPALIDWLAKVGVPVAGGGPVGQQWVTAQVYDAATNRLRCWSPRPLPGPVVLSRDGRLAAGVDAATGELQLVVMADGWRWLAALAAAAVPFAVAGLVGRWDRCDSLGPAR